MENTPEISMKKLSLSDDDDLVSYVRKVGDEAHLFNRAELTKITKSDGSIVTSGDLWVNDKICQYIRDNFKGDGILSEEIPLEPSDTNAYWIIDPIDGTNAYVRGDNYYRILVSRIENDKATIGLAYFPERKLMVYARENKGCYVNGKLARVSEEKQFKEHRAFSNIPINKFDGDSDDEIHAETGLAVIKLVQGEIDIVIDKIQKSKIWDVAAFFVIIEEAGGRVTNRFGQAPLFDMGPAIKFYGDASPNAYVVSNGFLHDEAIRRLNKEE